MFTVHGQYVGEEMAFQDHQAELKNLSAIVTM
jgi:hypothetical protein